MIKIIKFIFLACIVGVLGLVLFLLVANRSIINNAKNKTYNQAQLIPSRKVAVVLGTSPWLSNGRNNLYFDYRIQAATELYNNGKVEFIIVSGDNRFENYNEPVYMKRALIEAGIPEYKICMDFAGFTTYESVYRANAVFGQDNYIVVSQEFHNQRAIYIGEKLGLNIIGFNARDVNKYSGFKTRMREILSKGKAFVQVWFKPKPTFLGEKISLDTCNE